ncbi:MAG: hypothetical protein K2Z81_12385, partial [Cyanobacteria bacterium]|nr:hypothetical protein [Cyanobacteriota bacterium]
KNEDATAKALTNGCFVFQNDTVPPKMGEGIRSVPGTEQRVAQVEPPPSSDTKPGAAQGNEPRPEPRTKPGPAPGAEPRLAPWDEPRPRNDARTPPPGHPLAPREVPREVNPKDHNAKRDALIHYAALLELVVENPFEIAELIYKRFDDLEKAGRLKPGETAVSQLEKITRSQLEILTGQGRLTPTQRWDVVRGRTLELACPTLMVNQGRHKSCVLQAGRKAQSQGFDPAMADVQMAEAINTGKITVDLGDGRGRITIDIEETNFQPDAEAAEGATLRDDAYARFYGDAGHRSLTGQIGDAIWGATGAHLGTLRDRAEGKLAPDEKYIYLTAHSQNFGGPFAVEDTGEVTFRVDGQARRTFVCASPGNDLWDAAAMNKVLNPAGKVFVHENAISGRPSAYEKLGVEVITFSSPADAKQKFRDFQRTTGQLGQLVVNANFLPGNKEDGLGPHMMNAGVSNGAFLMDNNWGAHADYLLHGDDGEKAFDKATNPRFWPEPSDG